MLPPSPPHLETKPARDAHRETWPPARREPQPSPGRPATPIWDFEAIGTLWQIETAEPLPAEVAEAVTSRIESYDHAWSRFRDDSLVAQIARRPGRYRLPAEAAELFTLYRMLYQATEGALSPLVGDSLAALGYDRHYRLRAAEPQPALAWDDAVAWDGEALSTVRSVTIDVGAAGKGQLVDLVGELLTEHGIRSWVIDAGGDIRRRGEGTIRVGLEHPLDPRQAVGLVELGTGAVCASARNRRVWGAGLHHVLDATTGLPTNRVLGTWVLAPSAMVADGVATALFFAATQADAELLGAAHGASWVRMLESGRLEASADYPGTVFR